MISIPLNAETLARLYSSVRSLCRRYSPRAPEDVFQDSLLILLNDEHDRTSEAHIRASLICAIVNVGLNQSRRRSSAEVTGLELSGERTDDLMGLVDAIDTLQNSGVARAACLDNLKARRLLTSSISAHGEEVSLTGLGRLVDRFKSSLVTY